MRAVSDLVATTSPGSSPVEQQACTIFLFLLTVFWGAPGKTTGLRARVASQLPLSSGLGSSASFAVALATGCCRLRRQEQRPDDVTLDALDQTTLELINQWAYEGERLVHENPSGVDNTVVTFGGALAFRRTLPPVVLQSCVAGWMCSLPPCLKPT